MSDKPILKESTLQATAVPAGAALQEHGKDLLARVVSFKQSLHSGPIRVSLYGGDKDWLTLRKIVACVAILAAGTLAGHQLNQKDHTLAPQLTPTFTVEQACRQPTNTAIAPDVDAVRLIEVNYLGKRAMAIDEASRIRLSKVAAQMHALHETGLSWEDVYGVISAETAWIPRSGLGKNKVVSHGLAQFEPATAKAIGVADPNDPVLAVQGAAALIKEAAQWSKSKISHLKLKPAVRDARLREGISVYYNLSSAARRSWNGGNLGELPLETQYHVANFKDGRLLARAVERRLSKDPSATHLTSVSVHAGSDSASKDVAFCKAAVGAALAMATKEIAPDVIQAKVNGETAQYVNPSLMKTVLKESAEEQSLETGWKAFFASVYQQTSFDLKALQLSSVTNSMRDFMDKGVTTLADGWKMAEDWAASKGAKTALQKACGITAFQTLAAKDCARWQPDTALEMGDGRRTTVLAALAVFKLIRDDAPDLKSRVEISRSLIEQIGDLDNGGDVELFVSKAMTLHDFVGMGQSPDQLSDIGANARFIEALAKEGYTISDILRLYRAAIDLQIMDTDAESMAQMVHQVRDHHAASEDQQDHAALHRLAQIA